MKKNLMNNLGWKVFALVMAFMLWLIVLNINDPEKTITISNIPIQVINEDAILDQGKIYEIESGKTATVKVTGPRSIIDSLENSSFTATADLSKLSITNAVNVEVTINKNSYRSKVKLDVTTTMIVRIEDIVEEEYNVSKNFVGLLEKGYVVYDSSVDVDKVTVKAPKSVMDNIAEVAAQVDVADKNADFVEEVDIVALDKRGNVIDAGDNNITFSKNKAAVKATVYATKEVKVEYDLDESKYPGTIFISKELDNKSIIVAGRKENLEKIQSVKLDTGSFSPQSRNSEYELKYNIADILPENIYQYGKVTTITLTIQTDSIITRNFTIPVKDIAIKSIPDGYVASIEDTGEVTVQLSGKKSILGDFQLSDSFLYVSVDNKTEGTYQLEVLMNLDEGITSENKVLVNVTVAKKTSNSDTGNGNTPPGGESQGGQQGGNNETTSETTTGNSHQGEANVQ